MRRSKQTPIRQLLKNLRSAERGEIIEAGVELNDSERVPLKPLLRALRDFKAPDQREFAAYALKSPLGELESKVSRRRRQRVFARRVYQNDVPQKIARIIKTLLEVIDLEPAEKVRGQALETLATSRTVINRRHWLRKRIEKSVNAALASDSPEVRFWACFAAGSLKLKGALPKLRALAANDTADWGQWWPVAEEAADAVEWIHGRDTEDRIPFAQRSEKGKSK